MHNWKRAERGPNAFGRTTNRSSACDHKGDEVRCRLVAAQLAIGARLDVTQSTPPLMVARILLAIKSLHVDENEDHDWVFGQLVSAINGARAALRARCGAMKPMLLRDLTSVEVVPTMLNFNVLRRHHCSKVSAKLELAEQ